MRKDYREDEELTLEERIERAIDNMKNTIAKRKRKLALKYVKENPLFWRRLMLYCAYAK